MSAEVWTQNREAFDVDWRRGGGSTVDDGDEAAARRAAFDTWLGLAHAAQRPPCLESGDGDWSTWLFLGGRGAGKTRAGAQWLSAQARPGARLALVGPTLHEVREVMVEGESGLIASSAPGMRPRWEGARRRLVWPNGASASAFSAEAAEGLRGPQFHAGWADEFCAWRNAEATLANLRLGLRLGDAPKLVVTTTPRPSTALRRLRGEPGLVETRAGTSANAAHLAPGFVSGLEALYGGTRLAAQELEGQVLDAAGALFPAALIASARGTAPGDAFSGVFDRIVVAVDPPVAAGEGAGRSACGIVVVGRVGEVAWVLSDRTAKGLSPPDWAARVALVAQGWGADGVVAEANQGGEMVRAVLSAAGVGCPVSLVRAHLSKAARAEPVAALYDQGRVRHAGVFTELEEELMALGAEEGASNDRADALVWAVTTLLLERRGLPRVRVL